MKTVEEIKLFLKSRCVSDVLAVRVCNIAKEFATLDAFFTAKREDIERMYGRIAKGKKHGIGAKFWPVYDLALSYYNGKESLNDEAHCKAKHQKSQIDPSELHMISRNDLKKIVDMMEMLDVEAINFMEIEGFLRSVRFRQKNETADNPENS